MLLYIKAVFCMAIVTKGRGYVYSLQYHLVWCVKYRHEVISGEIEEFLCDILHKVASDNGFQITKLNTYKDHVHVLLDCKPQHYIPSMVKILKGVSGRAVMQKFGDDLRSKLFDGHLWGASYFVATVSENTESQVREYIRNQKQG